MGSSYARRTRSSASDILNPLMGVMVPTAQANSPAAATPQAQPRTAHSVFRVKPVSISREATAVRVAIATEAGIGGAPRRMRGIRRNQIPARV